jgi:hypothetical protein
VTAPTIELPLSPKQLLSVREASGRVNIWHGSVRSGKTVASLLRWVIDVATCDVQGEIVVVSRTRDSAARNVFALLMNEALFGSVAKHVSYTPGAATATVFGRKVWVLGSSDVRSETVLRGLTVCSGLRRRDHAAAGRFLRPAPQPALAWGAAVRHHQPGQPGALAQAQVPRPPRVAARLARLALPPRRQPATARGPEGGDPPGERRPLLPPQRPRRVGRGRGRVFPQWDPDVHVVAWDALPTMLRLLGVGVDYGTTNPSAGLLLGLGVDRRLYAVDEWRYDPAVSQVRLTDAQLSASFRTWLAAGHTPEITNLQPEWVVVDPAAASFKVQLHNDHVRGLADAENDVSYGIRTMSSLLGAQQLLVSDRCTGLITEIPGYSWDDKATEKGEDKPIKTADHSIDGMRYAVATTEALWQGQLTLEPREAA